MEAVITTLLFTTVVGLALGHKKAKSEIEVVKKKLDNMEEFRAMFPDSNPVFSKHRLYMSWAEEVQGEQMGNRISQAIAEKNWEKVAHLFPDPPK